LRQHVHHRRQLATHDLASESKAEYRAENCTEASGVPSEDPTSSYLLVSSEDGQPAIFERSTDGTGVVTTNRWTAADGEHYFVTVHSTGARHGDGFITALFRSAHETGWEYIVPAKGRGKRIIYNQCTIVKGADGIAKPTSAPSFTCSLVPTTSA